MRERDDSDREYLVEQKTCSDRPGSDGNVVRLLDGVRVVEAGTYMSVPFAGLSLAHLGAEVMKVEPPAGDPFRRFGHRYQNISAVWLSTNHGKQCIRLDLKSAEGVEALHELLATADIFLQNWRPGVAESLGLGSDQLSAMYPKLVHLSVTGYGPSGPKSDMPVFDGVMQAASGLASQEARAGRPPSMLRSFVVDKTVAGFVVQSVLAALLSRERTGAGVGLSLSMLDAIAYFNFPDLCQDRTFLPPAPPVDLDVGRSAILRTKDGYLLASPVSGRQISNALKAVGHPEWKDELLQAGSTVDLMNGLLDRLESVTENWTTAECQRRFDEHDVPATEVLDIDSHMSDPQTVHNRVYSTDTSMGIPVRRVRYPLVANGDLLPATRIADVAESSTLISGGG